MKQVKQLALSLLTVIAAQSAIATQLTVTQIPMQRNLSAKEESKVDKIHASCMQALIKPVIAQKVGCNMRFGDYGLYTGNWNEAGDYAWHGLLEGECKGGVSGSMKTYFHDSYLNGELQIIDGKISNERSALSYKTVLGQSIEMRLWSNGRSGTFTTQPDETLPALVFDHVAAVSSEDKGYDKLGNKIGVVYTPVAGDKDLTNFAIAVSVEPSETQKLVRVDCEIPDKNDPRCYAEINTKQFVSCLQTGLTELSKTK